MGELAETLLSFSFFGITVQVRSESTLIAQWLTFDFGRFRTETSSPTIRLNIYRKNPADVTVPPMVEASHSPEHVVYKDRDARWVHYYGRALACFRPDSETCDLFGDDEMFLYEKAYLFIHSRIGELLDQRGFHRVHALGFSWRDNGILYLIPMRGGKSTLAFRLRTYPECKLLSDDAPVIDDDGFLHPFPSRLGLLGGEVPKDIDPQFVRRFDRDGKTAKDLIHPDAVGEFWQTKRVPCSHVFIAKWTTAPTPSIERISSMRLFKTLVRDCVIGYGLPQIVEFFLRLNLLDILSKTALVFRRTYASIRLCRKAQGYEIRITDDHEANIQLLLETIRQDIGGR